MHMQHANTLVRQPWQAYQRV